MVTVRLDFSVLGTVTFQTWSRQNGKSVDEVELRASSFDREEPSGLTGAAA